MTDLTLFAATGDKTAIPDADISNGFSCGNFSRQTLNWLFAEAFGKGASLNTPTWVAGAYPSGSVTSLGGVQYRNESCTDTTAVPPSAPWVARTTSELYANPMGEPVLVSPHCTGVTYSPGSKVTAGGVQYRQEGAIDTTAVPPAAPWVVRSFDELYANPLGKAVSTPLHNAGGVYDTGTVVDVGGALYRQEGAAPTVNTPPAAPWVARTQAEIYQNPIGCSVAIPYFKPFTAYEPGSVVCDQGSYYRQDGTAATLLAPPAAPWVAVGLNDLLGGSAMQSLKAGQALPTTDKGVLWHDTYNSLMTWQTFNANGAAYTGYASVDIGRLIIESQPTPRTGWVKSGTMNLSKTAYAALWNWAVHNGVSVASGVWASGTLMYADNGDGTFRVADVRGEFPRFWDDGRGADTSRVFGKAQVGSLMYSHAIYGWDDIVPGEWDSVAGNSLPAKVFAQTYRHQFGALFDNVTGVNTVQAASLASPAYLSTFTGNLSNGTTRPRNTSFLAAIKF